MAIKNGKVNPLNVLGERVCTFPHPHFYHTDIYKYSPTLTSELDNWIYQNLNGRYYVVRRLGIIDNVIIYTTRIGFENKKELSFFQLACPFLT